METFDIVVVGGGPAGLAAGAEAARRGVSHVVLERGDLAQTIVWYQKRKLVMAEPADLPLHADHPLRFVEGPREAVLAAWADGIRAAGANVRTGPGNEVTGITGAKGAFTVALRDGTALGARHVVLALGQSTLNRFACPGADLPHVTYQLSDPDAHEDERIVVVGVGDAGIENALALAAKNEVSIVNSGTEFPRAQPRNQELMARAIATQQVAQYGNARVKRFEPGAIVLDTHDGEVRVEADLVIGRIGARPPTDFLRALGVAPASTDPNAVPAVSETYESSVPGIHLVGAIIGYPLIKNCLNQGYEVVHHVLGDPVAPADEPKLAALFAAAGLGGTVAGNLELVRARIPLFASITTVQLRDFIGRSKLLRVAAGDVITRRNARGDGLYAVLDGGVTVSVPASDAADDTVYGARDGAPEHVFPLGPGQFFGEMSLLSDRVHTGTTRPAAGGAVVLWSPRQAVLTLMRKDASVRRIIDEAFVFRRVRNLVGADVSDGDVAALARAAVVEPFEAGRTLFVEGDPPDGLHLVRRGSVTIEQSRHGRVVILAYVPAGNVIGEMALRAPDARRSATARATVYTESIRIPTEAIRPFLDAHPDVMRAVVDRMANERLAQNAARIDSQTSDVVDFLLKAGAGEATNILLIDESLCVRCNNCEAACAETHDGISRLDREAGPTFASVHVPTTCRHCENPKCMTDCPPDALRRHPNGEVFIMSSCIGCGNCERNCPYHVIQMAPREPAPRRHWLVRLLFGAGNGPASNGHGDDVKKIAVKCDLCRDLPGAACERSCPTGAIVRVDPHAYIDRLLPGSE